MNPSLSSHTMILFVTALIDRGVPDSLIKRVVQVLVEVDA